MEAQPRYCPRCGGTFGAEERFCPADGTHLLWAETRSSGALFAGRYHVERVLGRGGMGVVYQARQDKLERRVALKVLLAEDDRAAQRFLNEARVMSRLESAHTATVYDFGETDDGDLFLAMELLRGRTLRAALDDRGPLPLAVALRYVDAVAASLEEAHAQGIVHRDLKPGNVFLAETRAAPDLVKVLDFGIARLSDPAGRLTRSEEVLGTPLYLAPEAIRGEDVDARADVYALGLMFHELLTGRHPFAAETVFDVYRAHLEEDLPAVSDERPEATPPFAVQALIWAATAKDPRLRPADAAAFRARLNAAIVGEGGAALGATTTSEQMSPLLSAEPRPATDVNSSVAPRRTPVAVTGEAALQEARSLESAPERPPPEARVTLEQPDRYVAADDGVEIGRGGIGRVVTVRDTHLDREIARKELLSERAASEAAQERFMREARITGQLEHPSIVPVYELGRAPTGTYYYTMKLVRGRSLRQAIVDAQTVEQRMGLLPHVVDVCQAIAYAHSRGVVHRDVKPANVMLGGFGETVVLDWGLARVMETVEDDGDATSAGPVEDSGSLRTVHGRTVGTPAYMSPEQARGETGRLDQRSDIWSLGILLLEVLAGETPWGDASAHEVLTRIGRGQVPRLDELLAKAPPELAAVVRHALQADPRRRYQSAGRMAADVEAFLTGGRVSTYTYSTGELIRRLVRRNRGLTAALAGLLIAIIAGTVGVTSEWRRAEAARGDAVMQQQAAEQAERLAHQHLADSYRALAEKRLEARDHLGAAVFASASLLNDPRHEASPWFIGDSAPETVVRALSVLHAARAGTILTFIRDLTPRTRSMDLAAKGRRIAISTRERIEVIDLDSGAVLGRYLRPGMTLAISPDGEMLAEGDQSGALLSTIGGEIIRRLDVDTPKRWVWFSRDGRRLVTAGNDPRSVEVWDVATGRQIAAWSGFNGVFDGLGVTSDGTLVIATTNDFSAHFLRAEPERGRQTLSFPSESIYAVAFATNDTRVFFGTSAGNVWEVSLEDIRDRRVIATFPATIQTAQVSPDGRWLAVGHDRGAAVMSIADPTSRYTFQPSADGVDVVAWLDDRHLVTQQLDAPARLWGVAAAREVRMPTDGCDWTLVPLGDRRFLTAGAEGRIRWHDAATGKTERTLEVEVPIWQGALAPDREAVALTRDDRRVDLRRVADGALLKTFEVTEDNGLDVVFSPDGTRLAATTWNAVDLWDVSSGERLAHAKLGDGDAAALDTFTDESLVVSGTGGVHVLAWQDLARITSFERTNRFHFAVSVWPDGRSISTTGDTVDVLNIDTGTFSTRFAGHQGLVANVAWSPRGDDVASTGADRTARVWRPDNGAPRLIVPLAADGCALSYTKDGTALIVGTNSGTVYLPLELELWRTDPGKLLEQSEAAAGARLMGSELEPSYAD